MKKSVEVSQHNRLDEKRSRWINATGSNERVSRWINATGLTERVSRGINATGSTKDAGKKRSCVKGHHNLSESWANGLTSVKEMVASESRN